jgi:hypothetical protein
MFHGKRILCVMSPSRTTATQTHACTHAQSHTVFISAAISICLLNFSFTFHALCLGSLLPAWWGNQEAHLRLPHLFANIRAAQHCLATHTHHIYTSSTHKCLPTFCNTAFRTAVSRIYLSTMSYSTSLISARFYLLSMVSMDTAMY